MASAAIQSEPRRSSHSSHSSHINEDENEIYFSIPSMEELKSCLIDESAPIAKRMRTVFLLKQVGGNEAIEALTNSLNSYSVLLAHECAYVLGQMKDETAIPALNKYLADTNINPIVRHECAEA